MQAVAGEGCAGAPFDVVVGGLVGVRFAIPRDRDEDQQSVAGQSGFGGAGDGQGAWFERAELAQVGGDEAGVRGTRI